MLSIFLFFKVFSSAIVSMRLHRKYRKYYNASSDFFYYHKNDLRSTLVISKSKGPSETLRDIRTSTYQISRIEENSNRTTKFHKLTCNLTPFVRNIC